MFIENVSLAAIQRGEHFIPGCNAMLIQIVDPDMEFPIPKYEFKETHQFKFLDIEDNDDLAIQSDQALEIAKLLVKAKNNCMNVIVHCHAGICRSGAVAECGVIIGFDDTEVYRQPNLRVKRMVISHLFDMNAI